MLYILSQVFYFFLIDFGNLVPQVTEGNLVVGVKTARGAATDDEDGEGEGEGEGETAAAAE